MYVHACTLYNAYNYSLVHAVLNVRIISLHQVHGGEKIHTLTAGQWIGEVHEFCIKCLLIHLF